MKLLQGNAKSNYWKVLAGSLDTIWEEARWSEIDVARDVFDHELKWEKEEVWNLPKWRQQSLRGGHEVVKDAEEAYEVATHARPVFERVLEQVTESARDTGTLVRKQR